MEGCSRPPPPPRPPTSFSHLPCYANKRNLPKTRHTYRALQSFCSLSLLKGGHSQVRTSFALSWIAGTERCEGVKAQLVNPVLRDWGSVSSLLHIK